MHWGRAGDSSARRGPPRTEMQLPAGRPQQADGVGRGPGAQPLVLRRLELPEQPGGLVEFPLEHFSLCGGTKRTLENMGMGGAGSWAVNRGFAVYRLVLSEE